MPHVTLDNRSLIAIKGAQANEFLHNLVTSDIAGLPSGEVRPGALLTAQGKVLFAFLIFKTDDGFVLDVESRDAADFTRRLKFYRLRAKVDIGDPAPTPVTVSWDEPSQEKTGFRDARFKSANVRRDYNVHKTSASHAHFTSLRIAFGVAEAHVDYAYCDVFPHDINMDQTSGLSFSKGCYVGQEVISRIHHRGLARRRLMVATGVGLVSGAEIVAGGKGAGTIGSVSGDEALALVRLDRIKDALDRGAAIESNGTALTFRFPLDVSYDWPKDGEQSS